MDASLPENGSLNSYAQPDHFSLENVDAAVKLLGKNWYQAKIDLRKGYRSVPISPKNFDFTGIKWKFAGDKDSTYLIDTRLCMGASKAPSIFQKITSAVCGMMRYRGYLCIVYLDDFYVCAETKEECQAAYDFLWGLLTDLGFTINIKNLYPHVDA